MNDEVFMSLFSIFSFGKNRISSEFSPLERSLSFEGLLSPLERFLSFARLLFFRLNRHLLNTFWPCLVSGTEGD